MPAKKGGLIAGLDAYQRRLQDRAELERSDAMLTTRKEREPLSPEHWQRQQTTKRDREGTAAPTALRTL